MAREPIHLVTEQLNAYGLKKAGRGFTCRCPAHDDQASSLSVRVHADDSVSVKCFAGCTTQEVCAAMGLEVRDLFPNRERSHGGKPPGRAARPFEVGGVEYVHVCDFVYTDATGAPLIWKKRYDQVSPAPGKKARKIFTYERRLSNGDRIHGLAGGWHRWNQDKRRWEPESNNPKDERPDAPGRWEWFDEPPRPLFGLHHLMDAPRAEVWLTEGEKDATAQVRAGRVATTAMNGAGEWRDEWSTELARFGRVTIVADPDAAGLKGAIIKRESLERVGATVRVVLMGPAGAHADSWDWLVRQGGDPDEYREIDPVAELRALQAPDAVPPSSDPPTPVGPTPATEQGGEGDDPGRNDLDNAERFVAAHRDELRFCATFGAWLEWDGVCWRTDETCGEPVLRRWTPWARAQMDAAVLRANDPPTDEDKAMLRHASRSLNANAFKAALDLMKVWSPYPVAPAELDRLDDHLPVANGTLDLRTGELRPSVPGDLFTRALDVAYDPDADCPTWIESLRRATDGDLDLIEYLQEVVGYLLTGRVSEHTFWFFYGPPRSGKSVFVNTVARLLGPFCVDVQKDALMKQRIQSNTQPEAFARMKGARMATALEVADNDRWDEATMKKLTGGDPVTARALYQNSFTFDPKVKVVATGNYRPKVREQGESFWTRVRPVGFMHAVPAEQQDKYLMERLAGEMPGILLWAVDGARRWYERGRLPIPQAVLSQIEEYRREMDLVGLFLRSVTRQMVPSSVGYSEATGQQLYEAFKIWCKKTNSYELNSRDFGIQMKSRKDYEYVRRETGMTLRGYRLLAVDEWDLEAMYE